MYFLGCLLWNKTTCILCFHDLALTPSKRSRFFVCIVGTSAKGSLSGSLATGTVLTLTMVCDRLYKVVLFKIVCSFTVRILLGLAVVIVALYYFLLSLGDHFRRSGVVFALFVGISVILI